MEYEEFKQTALALVDEMQNHGATIRLLGAVAFSLHCPKYNSFHSQSNRFFTDLDFAGYFHESTIIRQLLEEKGFIEDRDVAVVYAHSRLIYNNPENMLHVDIFFDKLDFCHIIPWEGILDLDSPTIPLAELLLEKMQIVKINEKDIIDTLMLLREHPIGNNDHETINGTRISSMLSKDWGFWRTVTMNLQKVIRLGSEYSWLKREDFDIIQGRIIELQKIIDSTPKTPGWKIRSKIGDRLKWYKEVGEL